MQRALNAVTDRSQPLLATGVFDAATTTMLKAWQRSVHVEASGVVGTRTWQALAAGRQ